MIRSLIFDLDDTLYFEKDYAFSGFNACDLVVQKKYHKSGFADLAIEFFDQGKRGNIFNLVLQRLKIDFEQNEILELVKAFRNHRPDIKLLQDASWALNYYSKLYPMGLITDGYSVSQHHKIAALDIQKYFDKIVVTDDLGRAYWKPHAKPYEEIESYFKFAGSECCYVGDNVSKDFVTANELGWMTVQIQRPDGEYNNDNFEKNYQAQHLISSLHELKNIIL